MTEHERTHRDKRTWTPSMWVKNSTPSLSKEEGDEIESSLDFLSLIGD